MSFHNYTGGATPPNFNANSVNPSPVGPAQNTINAVNNTPDLLIDYNSQFKAIQPLLFRDNIISEIYAVLLAAKKPNALLIGPAGVGKTAIAAEIARQLANRDSAVPKMLQNMHVYELPLSNLVSGSSYVGQTEAKLNEVLDFATNPKNHVILFIDEIHLLMNSGNPEYAKLAQLLKPALARGDLHVIGATTTQEARDFMRDPAFSRRFANIIVDELTQSQEEQILQNALPHLLTHYQNQVQFDPTLLANIVAISDQILRPQTHRPDSGLTLLDRCLAETIVERQNQMSKAQSANNQIVISALKSQPIPRVNLNSISKIAKKIVTGTSQKPLLNKNELVQSLAPIVGQNEAKDKIIQAILLNQLGVFNQNKPFSFLLSGSSGVGKTMLAKIIANIVTNTEPITLNLTEYHSSASINRIIGSPAGYVGSTSHQELPFDSLESNPYQVILLDEFEKANPAVQRLFMRVLDEGKLQLANNHVIDFSKTIIFATTNAQHNNYAEKPVGFNAQDVKLSTKLTNNFDSELLNRFSRLIEFKSLDKNDFKTILQNKYQELLPQLSNKIVGLPNNLSNSELDELTKNFYDPKFGARPASRALESYISSQI